MEEFSFENNDSQDVKSLVSAYESMIGGDSSHYFESEEFELIIDFYDEQGRLKDALKAAEMGLHYFPFSPELLLKFGDLLIADERSEQALDVLATAETYNASILDLNILKVDAFLSLEKEDLAIAAFQQAIVQLDGEDLVDFLFECADIFDDYELFERVFDCILLILKEDPSNEEALYKICFWTDYTGRYEESIKLHQHILDENPYNEIAWFNLAAAFQGLKLYEKAIDAYQYAIAINEGFEYAYRNLGDVYIRLRKFENAIESLLKVVQLAPTPDDVLYEAIGHCYHRMQSNDMARKYYRMAIDLHAQDSKLYYKVALTYMDQFMWSQAIAPLKQAMEIQHAPEYYLALGECLFQMDDHKNAIQQFSIVVKLRPKSVPGWEALVRTLYFSEAYEETLVYADKALESTGGKPIFRFYLALANLTLGYRQNGLALLEEALAINPKLFKKILELKPSLLQNAKVVDLLAAYKHHRKS